MQYLYEITKGPISCLLIIIFTYAEYVSAFTPTPAPQSCTSPPANMVSWWPGDVDATDIQDGNDGVLLNGATAGVAGMVDGAFSFDGVNDFVSVADTLNSNLDITNQITIDTWIKPTSGSIGEIVNKFGPNSGYALRFRGDLGNVVQGQIGLGPGPSGFPFVISNNPIPLNQFSHVAMTYDGLTMRIYVNGVLDGIAPTIGVPIVANNESLNIGVNQLTNVNVFFFDGIIDEVEIFNRALSQSEIQSIFNAGSAGRCRGTIIIRKDTDPPGGEGFGFMNNIPGGPNFFTLNDGASQTFINVPTGTYEVTEDDPTISPGEHLLTDLSCDDMGSSTSINTRTATIDLDPNEAITCTFVNTKQLIGLNILKTDSPDPVVAGDELTYEITISNDTMDKTAINVMLTDLLPIGVTVVDVIAPGGVECTTTDSESVQCDIGELMPNESVEITIVVVPSADLVGDNPVIIDNIARLTADPGSIKREVMTSTEVIPMEEVNIDPDDMDKSVVKGETFTTGVDISVPSNGLANLNSAESEIISPIQRVDVQAVILDVEFSNLFEVESVETSQGNCTIGSVHCILGDMLEGQVVTVIINFTAPKEKGKFDIVYRVTTSTGQVFTNTVNIKVDGDGADGSAGCSLASAGTFVGFPTYLLLPILVLIRRIRKLPL